MSVDLDYSEDLLLQCNQLKHINLIDNDLTFDQILNIEEELLSPLNNISFVKIREKALECPDCKERQDKNCSIAQSKCSNWGSNCTTITKLNNLFKIAPQSEIQCYSTIDRKFELFDKTQEIFVAEKKSCEDCKEKEAQQNKLENKQAQLDDTKDELEGTQDRLVDTQSQLTFGGVITGKFKLFHNNLMFKLTQNKFFYKAFKGIFIPFFIILGLVICILIVVIIGLFSRQRVREILYRDIPFFFRDGIDGKIFIIHSYRLVIFTH